MKKLGIIGGLGYEATLYYYRELNRMYVNRDDGGNYPELVVYSVNVTALMGAMERGALQEVTDGLVHAVEAVARAGADFAVIASNTPHALFDGVQARSPIELISIVEETRREAERLRLHRLALLGTKYTMTHDFYQAVFGKTGIELVVPKEGEIDYIHDRIMSELERGILNRETKRGILDIVERIRREDRVEGVILGCTELPLMFPDDELGMPFLNTSLIHVRSALARLE
jgi:aspartate racemase